MARVSIEQVHTKDLALKQVQDATALAISRLAAQVPGSDAFPPVGTRLTWQQDTTGIYSHTPDLPDGWVRLDAPPTGSGGHVLVDPASPYNGQTLPTSANTILRVR